MRGFSKKLIYIFYDFIETNIIKDYQHAITHIQKCISLRGDEIILDIGGGTGYVMNRFASQVKKAISLDPSRNMFKHNLKKNIINIQANGLNLPLKDKSIDVIFLIHVLHHINKNHHHFLFKEVFRILKPNGICLILDLYYPMKFWNSIFTKFEEFAVGKTFHTSASSIVTLLNNGGISKVSIIYTDQKKWRFLIKAENF